MEDVREKLQRDASPEEHDRIRALWKAHSLAEDRRDVPGLPTCGSG